MMKIKGSWVWMISVLLWNTSYAQFNVIITNAADFPAEINNSIFIAGNFNEWNPADSSSKLFWLDGKLQATLKIPEEITSLEYKFTCGSWEKGEVKKDGSPQPNRNKFYIPGMVVTETIETFAHIAPKWSPKENTSIIKFTIYSPELKRDKTIRVSLPCNYELENIRYPVLYMLDGQNLFDATLSQSGEWGVDEAMDSVCALNKLPAIVIGIDNAGDDRIAEYSPFIVDEHAPNPQGEAFADFVVNTLKPKIDSLYRTKPQREFTGIAGSSMGGVESMYVVIKFNEIFSKAGIFSPAFWTSENNYKYVQENKILNPTKIYFLAGAMEGQQFEMVHATKEMYDIILNQNNVNINSRVVFQSTGYHTESFWNDEFFEMFEWLYER